MDVIRCGSVLKPLVFLMLSILSGCMSTRPAQVDDVCLMFKQNPSWYQAAKKTQKRWHLPIATQMAIIHQESRFDPYAQPERTQLLGFIPWTRPSSAYGYSQALDMTWSRYKKSQGKYWASRSNFEDSVDFIGWYANQAHQRADISYWDPYALYLAYHEGVGGYQRGTYQSKQWLMAVARKVRYRSSIYSAQLAKCQSQLNQTRWFF